MALNGMKKLEVEEDLLFISTSTNQERVTMYHTLDRPIRRAELICWLLTMGQAGALPNVFQVQMEGLITTSCVSNNSRPDMLPLWTAAPRTYMPIPLKIGSQTQILTVSAYSAGIAPTLLDNFGTLSLWIHVYYDV